MMPFGTKQRFTVITGRKIDYMIMDDVGNVEWVTPIRSSLTVRRGSGLIVLRGGPDSSAQHRWNLFAIEGLDYVGATTVGLRLICRRVATEEERRSALRQAPSNILSPEQWSRAISGLNP